jgi:Recombination endonuclease VII
MGAPPATVAQKPGTVVESLRGVKDMKQYAKAKHLRTYGLTPDDYEKLWGNQRGCCFTCGDPLDVGKHTHVDHDHDTGQVRTLLCHGCNIALGAAAENPETLRKLMLYAAASRVDRVRAGA